MNGLTFYGTHHFVSRTKAIRYYAKYDGVSATGLRRADMRAKYESYIDYKLAAGEIAVGQPSLKPGQTLHIDSDGRYSIGETA